MRSPSLTWHDSDVLFSSEGAGVKEVFIEDFYKSWRLEYKTRPATRRKESSFVRKEKGQSLETKSLPV